MAGSDDERVTDPGFYSSDKAATVSVSRQVYDRMVTAARERGISLHTLIRLACADILHGAPDPNASRWRNRAAPTCSA